MTVKPVNKILVASIIAVIGSATLVLALSNLSIATTENSPGDSVTLLLGYQRFRPGQFILLYDSTPKPITSGHLAINVDCDATVDGTAPIKVAVGVAPDLELITLDMKNMVHELSEHGKMCLYHLDLPHEEGMAITDIALINTSDRWVRLGPEASVTLTVYGVGEPLEHSHGH